MSQAVTTHDFREALTMGNCFLNTNWEEKFKSHLDTLVDKNLNFDVTARYSSERVTHSFKVGSCVVY
jgi:hypothetical protein